jgi:hypothetical protein
MTWKSDRPDLCYRVSIMAGRLRFALLVALAVVGVPALGACESPTLPLPPPALPSITSAGLPAGEVKLQSVAGAEPLAIIVTLNHDTAIPYAQRAAATEADPQGSWTLVIAASPGDYVDITQGTGDQTSPPLTVQIPTL